MRTRRWRRRRCTWHRLHADALLTEIRKRAGVGAGVCAGVGCGCMWLCVLYLWLWLDGWANGWAVAAVVWA
eukprot:COSAG01_NODE_1596_length_9782_cov_16.488692_1_plen_71_part_00